MKVLYHSQILHNAPRIHIVDDFIDTALCSHFIHEASDSLHHFNPVNHEHSHAFAEAFYMIKKNDSLKTINFIKSVSDLVSLSSHNSENLKVSYFKQNDSSPPHHDAFSSKTDLDWTRMRPSNGGQRILTCLFFLNDVEEGGEIFFPKIDLKIKPKQGRAVIFSNIIEGTNDIHPLAEYCSLPIIKGEKWDLSIWFRENQTRSLI